jgi:hypothetical protein
VDEFEQAQAQMGRPGVSGWWQTMDLTVEQRAKLAAAAGNPAITHRAIATVLCQWGVNVNVGQVGHWRRNIER